MSCIMNPGPGFKSDRLRAKTVKLVFVFSPISMQHYAVRVKTGWPRNQNNLSEWSNPWTVVSVS